VIPICAIQLTTGKREERTKMGVVSEIERGFWDEKKEVSMRSALYDAIQ